MQEADGEKWGGKKSESGVGKMTAKEYLVFIPLGPNDHLCQAIPRRLLRLRLAL